MREKYDLDVMNKQIEEDEQLDNEHGKEHFTQDDILKLVEQKKKHHQQAPKPA